MPYRVVQWSTGNVGRHSLAGINAHPDLHLVGVYVSNPEKVGHDAGELAGLASTFGVAATSDVDALLALKPDCIVHTGMADDRIFEALQDLERFLAAGINVVSSSPVMLQYPAPDDPLAAPVIAAAEKAGVSIFVNGVDPGFANDALPLVLSGVSERIEEVRCSEVLNYATYNQPMVLFGIMGFGGRMDKVPFILTPGVLTMAWGSVVRQIAAGLGLTLTDVTEWHEREAAPEDFEVDAGMVKAGTTAAMHFEVRGMVGDRAVIVLEHVTRLRSRPARAATAWRSRGSPTTRSTSSSWAPTATTTRRGSRRRRCDSSTPCRPWWRRRPGSSRHSISPSSRVEVSSSPETALSAARTNTTHGKTKDTIFAKVQGATG
jgi:4-hydroxy-tetrahydrodipicolinate reductase